MPRAIPVTMVLLALVLAVPTPSAAATVGSHDRCRVAKSRTIVQNSRWRIFSTTRPGNFYGCSRRTGRKRFIAGDDVVSTPTQFRLVGDVVAFEITDCERETTPGTLTQCASHVTDIDLRLGHRRATPFVSGVTIRLELSTKRRLGFTVRRADGAVAVYAKDRGGLRVLEEAADIDPTSLRECGARLTWTRGRELHAARLV